jgi:hypothetical protein
MTTRVCAETPASGNESDPFFYGYRYVERVDDRGAVTVVRVPLTPYDVLHPQEDDRVTQNDPHARRCDYLFDVFRARVADDPTTIVLHDMRIDWQVPDLEPHGPDIAVMLGVRERKEWSTFHVKAEGARPALIVEVTSPATVVADRAEKFEEYALAGVPIYVIVDAVLRRRPAPPRLLGYRLEAGRYQPLTPDERGRLWLEPVRAWLGIEAEEIICYDEAGQPLGDYPSLAAELAAERRAREEAEQAERRAREEAEQAERRAREEAEARLRALEEELRRLRGGS